MAREPDGIARNKHQNVGRRSEEIGKKGMTVNQHQTGGVPGAKEPDRIARDKHQNVGRKSGEIVKKGMTGNQHQKHIERVIVRQTRSSTAKSEAAPSATDVGRQGRENQTG